MPCLPQFAKGCAGSRGRIKGSSIHGSMRHIAVATTSRADWGHVEPVLRMLGQEDGVRTSLLVGGAHLEPRFGRTIVDVERAGYEVAAEVPFLAADDSDLGMAEGIGRATTGFARVFQALKPDIVLLIADRFEMIAPASAAMAMRIPIAHIEGGEISEGAIDQQVRDALTKMSHLHFVPTAEAQARVIAMGEEPWRVFVSGAPSLDHLVMDTLPDRCAVEAAIGQSLDPPPVVIAFHPTTIHRDTTDEAVVFFEAIEACSQPLVFCFPNADAGYRRIIEMAESICERRSDAVLRVNLDHLVYWALVREAACLAGNSSSGIMEAASFGIPAVNVGVRQQGRTRARNIIDASVSVSEIQAAIRRGVDPTFRSSLSGMVNPYGTGQASALIVKILASTKLDAKLLQKKCGLRD